MEEIDPDKILEEVERETQLGKLGKLKIFFGMAAGVGKTYTMLQEAHEKLKEGLEVVVGVVNTHGRRETEKLLEGLKLVPKKWITYRDNAFEEFDIDAVLALKPHIVILDELAHSNVPGSRHPKRWQDAIELLDAGINVYTTLNVQHIESRKEVIESFTGIMIRETVPDLILERASTIELIDISPGDLLQRLREGKVYLGDQSKIAAQHFFKEENLTALREIALRLTAEKVDHDLHHFLLGKRWHAREKLLVGISSNAGAESLIRSARKLAFEIDAPWVVGYVDTGEKLDKKAEARLERFFNLARELGAEVVTTKDYDVAEGLQRIAVQKEVTRVLLSRSGTKNVFKRLAKHNKNLDLILLRNEKVSETYQRTISEKFSFSPINHYLLACLQVVLTVGIGYLLAPIIGYKAIGFLFLLGLLALSLFVSLGPIFLSVILSTAIWTLFFARPFNYEDVAFVIIYFCTAILMGLMTTQMRKRERIISLREKRSMHLYEINKLIAQSTDIHNLNKNITPKLSSLFSGAFIVLVKDENGVINFSDSHLYLKEDKEKFTLLWAMQKGVIVGAQTDTLPLSKGIYFPILFSNEVLGALAYFPQGERLLTLEDRTFLQSVTDQLGVYLERSFLAEIARGHEVHRRIEKLYEALLQTFKSSFYAPVEAIEKVHRELVELNLGKEARELLEQANYGLAELKFIQNNIATMSELESGFVHFEKEKRSVDELITVCIKDIKTIINGHLINYLPRKQIFNFDFKLMRLALDNILLNAVHYSPEESEITIHAEIVNDILKLSVNYEGRGIQEELLSYLFEKFYHIEILDENISMTHRLGLSIVKTVVELHNGEVQVNPREGGGTTIVLLLGL